MENTKELKLSWLFQWWMYNNRNLSQTPYQYASYFQNGRVYSKTSMPRKWYAQQIEVWTETDVWIRWLYNFNSKFALWYNGNLYISPENLSSVSDKWALEVNATYTQDIWPSFISYWKYLMALNWGDNCQVYDEDEDTVSTFSWAAQNAIMWDILSNSMWISQWKYAVVRSKPATSVNPENIFDFNTPVDSPVKTFSWKVLWIKSSLSTLYVFTEWEIHYFQNSYNEQDWLSIPVFNKIYDWSAVVSSKAITSIDNTVFFLTKDKKIKSIKYVSWITNPQIWEVSNQKTNSIQGWLDDNLDDDQSMATSSYFEPDNLIKFNVKSVWATYNDTVVIYDLKNQTFYIDKWKNFWTETVQINWNYYVWDVNQWLIYKDEFWWSDNWNDIEFIRDTREFNFWNPAIRKLMREMLIAWSINLNTTIQIMLFWDYDEELKDIYLDKNIVSNSVFWYKTINKLYRFRRVFTKWELYEKAYNYTFRFYAIWKDMDFSLDFATVRLWILWDGNLNELVEK